VKENHVKVGKQKLLMSDLIVIRKLNEAFVKVECEPHLAQELSSYFTFYVPGHQFTPAFKARL
jgi:hypothetical protein